MNGFTFWRSFYEVGKELTRKQRLELYGAIIEYAFSEEEPKLTGGLGAVFAALKPGIDASIRRSKAAKKTEEGEGQNEIKTKSKRNQNEIKTKSKANQNKIKTGSNKDIGVDIGIDIDIDKDIDIYTPPTPSIESMGFTKELEDVVKDWTIYKAEKTRPYRPKGLKTLLNEIKKNAGKYGDANVAEVIRISMSNNYAGISWGILESGVDFRAFPQRKYDFDELEMKLLNGGKP